MQGKHLILGSYTSTNTKLLMTYGQAINPYCYKITFIKSQYIETFLCEVKNPPMSMLEHSPRLSLFVDQLPLSIHSVYHYAE